MNANQPSDFFEPQRHGFMRMAVAVPRIRVADPAFNAEQTVALLKQAAGQGAALVVFPELGLSAYTCDDLFHQRALLDACESALEVVAQATSGVDSIAVVGMPWRVDHHLFNCAFVLQGGKVLGVVPKTYLPNYGEFYEARQFNPADHATATSTRVLGQDVPFGSELLFKASNHPLFVFHVEICEDVWVPIPPSCYAALASATVLVNLSASNITLGKAAYRHQLVSQQSSRCVAAYLYASAGMGESTTDLAWDGQSLICENGELLAESPRFEQVSHVIVADVDLERVSRERMRQTSYGQSVGRHKAQLQGFRTVPFELAQASPNVDQASSAPTLRRHVGRFPYVPTDAARRDERCQEVYRIQVQGLMQRLSHTGGSKLIIGVSGGLDSTQALLVCAKAMDLLGRPRTDILGFTMPGFATSSRTLDQAHRLMAALGCTAREIDIRPSCEQMLADLGHPYASGQPVYDIAFENVQAGERTSHLFRLANFHHGFVVGTGDLSELALGWCTYGVGDHMSHYNVNASVPKTLIKHLVRWVADSGELGEAGSTVLHDIVDTEVSPELVPSQPAQSQPEPGQPGEAQPGQRTEDVLGPYELHDFFLYQILRYGFAPSKVAFLAHAAWHDIEAGVWPHGPQNARHAYTLSEIKRHLRVFLTRFFQTSQFKRSCIPNAPKVGSGGSLSPRGDWRAPSDSQATAWLSDLDNVPDR